MPELSCLGHSSPTGSFSRDVCQAHPTERLWDEPEPPGCAHGDQGREEETRVRDVPGSIHPPSGLWMNPALSLKPHL